MKLSYFRRGTFKKKGEENAGEDPAYRVGPTREGRLARKEGRESKAHPARD